VEKRYLQLIRRWWWVLVIAPLITGGIAYFIFKDKPPIYQAETRLLIGPGIDTPDPDLNALRAGGQLMQTYAELSSTGPFLQEIIDELDLQVTPLQLSKRIEVRSSAETQIMRITVQHEDPRLAVSIANVAAETLVGMSPTGSGSPTALLKEQMRLQTKRLEQIIADSQSTVEGLEADLRSIANEEQKGLIVLQTDNYLEKQRLIVEQLSQERARLSDALTALTMLYDSLQKTPTNQVEIVEPASASIPLVSQLRLTVLMAGLAGLILAAAAVVAFEYFDDTIKSVEDLTYTAGLAVLGIIDKEEIKVNEGFVPIAVKNKPGSNAAECYRLLGSKLISKYKFQIGMSADESLTSKTSQLNSILIGSSQLGGNIGQIAANLAVVLSQTDRKAILIDANLQNPIIDKLFGIEKREGLVDVISDPNKKPESVLFEWSSRLSILTCGFSLKSIETSDPFGMLASDRMGEVIRAYENQAAFVIVAGSPFLEYADSFVLASRVDGVIVVAHHGESRRSAVKEVIDSLHALDVHIVGSILDYNAPMGFIPSPQDQKAKRFAGLIALGSNIRGRAREKTPFQGLSFVHLDPVKAATRSNNLETDDSIPSQRNDKERRNNEIFPIQAAKS
jgi:succinoglycan biosynthesis transport protein ExoP